MFEAASLTVAQVKLEVDFENILKLQRKRAEYSRRVCDKLPLMLYDDFKGECKIFQQAILSRRLAGAPPLSCVVLMKDGSDGRLRCVGNVLGYNEQEQMFIVEVGGKRYFFNRLCVQFPDIEVKENLEKRRVEAMHLAKSVFMRVNIEHVLIEEVLRLRPELRQPAFLTNNIERLLGLK